MRRLLFLFAPLALGLAACGSGGSGGGSSSTSSTATTTPANASATVNDAIAKSAKQPVHAEVSGQVSAAGEQVQLSGSGDVDPRSHRGTMHMTIGLGGQKVPLDEVLDGKTVYASSTLFKSFLPSGKKWLKLDVSSAAKTFGPEGFALTAQPGSVPPLKDARPVGTATIGGVQTTEYSGRVDRSKLSPSAAAAFGGTHARLGAIDVWVGGDGYVHRVRVDMSSSAGGKKAKVALTSTMSNYGETVHVSVPPASETVDATKIGIPGLSA